MIFTNMTLSCIPDMVNYITDPDEAKIVKCCRPSGNQIYSVLYASGQSLNLITNGIASNIESDFESWFVRIGLANVIPWMLMFIIQYIVLMITKIISPATGIALICTSIILALVGLLWLYGDATLTTNRIYNSTIDTINNNWNNNRTIIQDHLLDAYNLQASCNSDESNACCGFSQSQCELFGCNVIFSVNPLFVTAGTTGILRLFILNAPTGTTGGTITIPGELRNSFFSETIPIQIPPDGNTTVPYQYHIISPELLSPGETFITGILNNPDGDVNISVKIGIVVNQNINTNNNLGNNISTNNTNNINNNLGNNIRKCCNRK